VATVSWNALPDASSYSVFRSTTSGGPYTTLVAFDVAGTSCDDYPPDLELVEYYYVVAANTACGQTGDSNEVATSLANCSCCGGCGCKTCSCQSCGAGSCPAPSENGSLVVSG
jgi:hypothetical protein